MPLALPEQSGTAPASITSTSIVAVCTPFGPIAVAVSTKLPAATPTIATSAWLWPTGIVTVAGKVARPGTLALSVTSTSRQ